jgi:flagellum-specific peptidoglycan hydrolase FlgJ
MKHFSWYPLVAGVMLAAAPASYAQSLPWINPAHVQTYAGMDPTSQVLRELEARDRQATNSTSSNTTAQSASRTVVIDSTYRYSPSRTQQNLRTFITKTPEPAARANLEQMITVQPSLMDDIKGAMRGYGFDPHNVADAYAAWWITVWGIANKQNIEPDAGTVAAVKQQVRNAFAATPDFANTTDAQRQEYAEALLLQAAMMGSSFEQWKSDPNLIEQLAEAARKGAKDSGLDLSLMTLTPNGFVPRKGADASSAVGGADDTIRNARADSPADESESSSLGLALAAGAGVGVTLLGGLALMRRG